MFTEHAGEQSSKCRNDARGPVHNIAEEVTSVPKFMNQPKVLPDHVLDAFKYELADELGITPKIRDGTW